MGTMHTCEGCGATFDTAAELDAHLERRPIYVMTGTHMSIDQYERYIMGCDMPEWEPGYEPYTPPASREAPMTAEEARHLRALEGIPF